MLARILERRPEIAETIGIPLADDPFLFSHAPDSLTPMDPGYLTSRVAVLKSHLGIEDMLRVVAAWSLERGRPRDLDVVAVYLGGPER